jgi:hypothetical protein
MPPQPTLPPTQIHTHTHTQTPAVERASTSNLQSCHAVTAVHKACFQLNVFYQVKVHKHQWKLDWIGSDTQFHRFGMNEATEQV